MNQGPAELPEGFVIIDKPAGQTSHAVLAGLARELGRPYGRKLKAGHAGTLDSFATGVLICLFGRYTRLSDYFMSTSKTYLAGLCFGSETDTLDPDGQVIAEADLPASGSLDSVLTSFRGSIDQTPPVYSAVHIQGQRAWQRALHGEAVDMPSRTVHIHRLEALEQARDRAVIEVHCSKGTYIRSLARDIGLAAGSRAHLGSLRRTSSGPFTVDKAIKPEAVQATDLRRLDSELATAMGLVALSLDSIQARAFSHGRPLYQLPAFGRTGLLTDDPGDGAASVAAFDPDGLLLGICRFERGAWQYAVVLSEGQ